MRRQPTHDHLVTDLVERLRRYRHEGVPCRSCRRWSGSDTREWVKHNGALYCRECADRLRLQPDPR